MKTKETINVLFLILLSLVLPSCKKDGAKGGSGGDANFGYIFQDVAPEKFGGPWKRVWSLTGVDVADVAVDEITKKSDDNWKEISRTNNQGVYIQSDTTRELKLRFDGTLESPWMPALKDELVQSFAGPVVEQSGLRCVIPPDTTVYVENGRLDLNCDEVVIAGSIKAFPATSLSGRGAGSVLIKAKRVSILGSIDLTGETGVPGQNGADAHQIQNNQWAPCTPGKNGFAGGNGGRIIIKASEKFTLPNESQLSAAGGDGGFAGLGGKAKNGGPSCKGGVAGANGGEGIIELDVPELH
jgi:hypothetical protein